MQKVLASIITIGDELLIGQTVDTNSAWIAQRLNAAGIWVQRRVSVGDEREAIRTALDYECGISAVVLITGGLGPTSDDITKPFLCDYFGGKLILHEPTLAHIKYLFEHVFRRPGALLDRNLRQADVPDVCTVLFNRIGTAPGMWFEKNGAIVVSMPGVPREMMGIMTEEVMPRLAIRLSTPAIAHRTVFTFGAGESYIAERLVAFEEELPTSVKLAYLPHYGMVRLRLTATGDEATAVHQQIDDLFVELCRLVEDITVVNEDLTMEEYVGRLLRQKRKTMVTAESCTGGTIAHLLTAIPGSSDWYRGGIIPYAVPVKETLLHVPPSMMASEGVVSEAVVTAMVKGILQQMPADYAVATSGIMGPSGGTDAIPVGTVWVAAGNRERVESKVFHFRYDRNMNIQLTAIYALNMLRLFILES